MYAVSGHTFLHRCWEGAQVKSAKPLYKPLPHNHPPYPHRAHACILAAKRENQFLGAMPESCRKRVD